MHFCAVLLLCVVGVVVNASRQYTGYAPPFGSSVSKGTGVSGSPGHTVGYTVSGPNGNGGTMLCCKAWGFPNERSNGKWYVYS